MSDVKSGNSSTIPRGKNVKIAFEDGIAWVIVPDWETTSENPERT